MGRGKGSFRGEARSPWCTHQETGFTPKGYQRRPFYGCHDEFRRELKRGCLRSAPVLCLGRVLQFEDRESEARPPNVESPPQWWTIDRSIASVVISTSAIDWSWGPRYMISKGPWPPHGGRTRPSPASQSVWLPALSAIHFTFQKVEL